MNDRKKNIGDLQRKSRYYLQWLLVTTVHWGVTSTTNKNIPPKTSVTAHSECEGFPSASCQHLWDAQTARQTAPDFPKTFKSILHLTLARSRLLLCSWNAAGLFRAVKKKNKKHLENEYEWWSSLTTHPSRPNKLTNSPQQLPPASSSIRDQTPAGIKLCELSYSYSTGADLDLLWATEGNNVGYTPSGAIHCSPINSPTNSSYELQYGTKYLGPLGKWMAPKQQGDAWDGWKDPHGGGS